MNSLTTPSFWDRSAPTSKSWPSRWCRLDQEIIRQFHPFLEEKRGGRFVELGCGSSYLLPYFAKTYDFKVYGIDFSESRLEQTTSNLSGVGITGTLVNRDLRIPVEAWQGKFDVVYSGGVVEHFSSPADVLNVARTYLKPDGVVITTVPHLKGFWGACGALLNKDAAKGYKRMDLKDLVKAHQDAGMKVIYSSYFRLGDASILNYGKLPRIFQLLVYGLITIGNIGFLPWRTRAIIPTFESDMAVVAKC